MFHKPAHKDTTTPPGQVRNPVPSPAPARHAAFWEAAWARYAADRNANA